jgi:hypothetical protein
MAVAWLLFPLVLLAVALGCGLLVERAAGRRLPGALLPSLGLALVVVAAELCTDRRATAGLATAAVVVLASAGYVLGWRRLRGLRPDPWAVGVGVALFAVFAAPVVLSGHATFLGYFFLNDTAWHLVLMDQLLDRGRDVAGLPPGSFSGIAAPYLANQYPVGTQLVAASVRPLVGQDLAWLMAPYMAVVLALVGVTLHQLLARAVRPPVLRALVAIVAAQPGLVYAYYAQSSIKELGTLWILVVLCAVVVAALEGPPGLRRAIPVALVGAAGLDVLNLAVAPWIGVPLAVFAVAFGWQERRRAPRWAWAAALAGAALLGLALAYPALRNTGRFVEVAQRVLQTKGDLGNLVSPLQGWQIFGIWPSGDFRFAPGNHQPAVFVLIGLAIAGALLGVLWVLRRRPPAVVLLVASSLIAYVYLVRTGSPYANGKTMMIASPAVVLVALLGAVALHEVGRRVEAWALALAITAGVVWTNALAYHDVNLAPRPRLAELRSIGERHPGRSMWLDEWDEFAAHFTRPAVVANMPIVVPPPAPGVPPRDYRLAKYPIDVDEVRPDWLQRFAVIVLRRSPLASLPPADYRPVSTKRYYEVWRRGGTPVSQVLEHVALGQPQQPNKTTVAAVPPCSTLRALAGRAATRGARLAYVERPNPPVFVPTRAHGRWTGTIDVPAAGRYLVWASGVFDRTLTIRIAGRPAGSVGHQLGAQGEFTLAGRADLPAGREPIRIHRPGSDLSPGDGGTGGQLGVVALTPLGQTPHVAFLAPGRVDRLCGRSLDWIEVVR